jgi:hypothetical protein
MQLSAANMALEISKPDIFSAFIPWEKASWPHPTAEPAILSISNYTSEDVAIWSPLEVIRTVEESC